MALPRLAGLRWAMRRCMPMSSHRGPAVVAAAAAAGLGALTLYSTQWPHTPVRCDSRLDDGSAPAAPAQPLMRQRVEQFVKSKQKEIVEALEQVDGGKFRVDTWTRPEGGEGVSCVLQDSHVFEKAGVNVSIVHGQLGPRAVEKMRADHQSLQVAEGKTLPFFAAGISLVVHPRNPNAPTVHLNYRYFEVENEDGTPKAWWFGGGSDLTPSQLYDEDAILFHRLLKEACDRHDKTYYSRFKAWCDDYFWIKHRNEARGVGGIFFDDLDDKDPEQLFAFAQDCAGAFLPAYIPIMNKRKDMPFGPEEKMFQQIRRGRYVEFNLVYDRGTAFGLNTPGARIESILMSLPLTASWYYEHVPAAPREIRLMNVLREPKEWV